MTDVRRNCVNCKYFNDERSEQPDRGICQRYPPVVYPTGPQQTTSFWPVVQVNQWCGEWTVRLEVTAAMPAEGVVRQ